MSRQKENHEKEYPNKLGLESLQAGLSKSKEDYKIQANSLEQLIAEANRLKKKNPYSPKAKPASITFKKK